MKLAITKDGDDVHVWAMLDDPDYNANPTERGESFVIGSGSTIPEAVAAAQVELEAALGELAVMEHDEQQAVAPTDA